MEFTNDVVPHRDLCLDLEYRASEPYSSFVFNSEAEARRIQACLFDAGVSDVSPPHATLTMLEGRPVAIDSGFGWERFAEIRAGAAVVMARAGLLEPGTATVDRMRLADQVLFKPSKGDYYGSRSAVVEDCNAGGLAVFLMKRRIEEARALGYRRYIGEVASHVTPMLRICIEGFGFDRLGEKRVQDPQTGRLLELVHVARYLQ